jgi:hypothetical protein
LELLMLRSLALWSLVLAGNSFGAQTTAPTEWNERLFEVLQAPTGNGNVTRAVSQAVAESATGNRLSKTTADQLVQALTGGAPHGALSSEILQRVTVSDAFSHQDATTWKLGSFLQRIQLAGALWDRAVTIAAASPADAASYARAAALLAAHEDFRFGPATAQKIIGNKRFSEIARLTPEQATAVNDLLKAMATDSRTYALALVDATHRLQSVIDQGAPTIAAGDAQAVLVALDTLWNASNGYRGRQYQTANLLWRFACLARSKHDDATLAAARATAAQWALHTNDRTVKRWIDEAITIPGEAPKNSGVDVLSTEEFEKRHANNGE